MAQARVLNGTQAKTILTVIAQGKNAHRNTIIFALSYYGGMRSKEIASLSVSDVITEDGRVKDVISLDKTMTKGKRAREVFLNTTLKKYLTSYLKNKANKWDKPLVSPMGTFNRFTPNSLSIVLNNIYKKAGFEGCSSHSGRRSFATHLSQKGTSIRVIQRLGGWSSIASVMPYLDANEEMLKEAVELVS
jgi:integrase/recombinase XerD